MILFSRKLFKINFGTSLYRGFGTIDKTAKLNLEKKGNFWKAVAGNIYLQFKSVIRLLHINEVAMNVLNAQKIVSYLD